MTGKTFFSFLIPTFVITWGLASVLIKFGMITPVFLLAVYSPGIVGIFLVWKHYGLKGLGKFFRRLTMWRMHPVWWLYLVIGIPSIMYAGAFINGTINEPLPGIGELMGAIFVAMFILGTNEEFGWRGVALPLLQRKFAPVWAGLILGFIWSVWHIPAFYIGGLPFETWSVLPYFGGVVALSVILTPMFNSAKGSLLIPYLYHFQIMNPIFPDAQPWDSLIIAIVAVVVVFINRKTMFRKGSGVTEVLGSYN